MDLFFIFIFLVVTHPPLPLCIIVSVTMDRIRILTYCSFPQLYSRTQTEKVLGVLDRQKQKRRSIISGLKIALTSDKTTWVSSAAEVKDVAANPCAHQTAGVESSVCIQCINGNVDKHCLLQPHNCIDCWKNPEMDQNITGKLFLTWLCSLWLSGSHWCFFFFFF